MTFYAALQSQMVAFSRSQPYEKVKVGLTSDVTNLGDLL